MEKKDILLEHHEVFFSSNQQTLGKTKSLQTLQLKEWRTENAYIEDTYTYKNTDLASRGKVKYNFSKWSSTYTGLLVAKIQTSYEFPTAKQNAGTVTSTVRLQTNHSKGTGNTCLPS